MACDYHNGKALRVSVAGQTFAAGDSFDGAALTAQVFRPQEGGFTFEEVPQIEVIAELNAAQEQVIVGGSHWIWSLSFIVDWDERANAWVLTMKDTPATSGAGPFVHVLELSNLRYFGEIVGWYATADGETYISETLGNCWSTSTRFSLAPNVGLICEMSGIASLYAHDDEEVALPSITATTPVQASQITTLTIAGETGFRLASLGLNLSQPSTEADGYSLAAADMGKLDYIDIEGQREVTLDTQLRSREAILTVVNVGDIVDGLILEFQNGLAAGLARALKFETGDLVIEKMPQSPATLSRIIQDVSSRALTQGGFDLKVTLTDGNAAIPIP